MSQPRNPFETPRPRGTTTLQGMLRVIVCIQCLGLAAGRLHQGRFTPLSAMFAQGKDWTKDQVVQFENGSGIAMAALGVGILFQPSWITLIPVLFLQTGIAVATVVMEQGSRPLLEALEMAVRIGAPMALLLVDFWPPRIRPNLLLCLSATAILRLATVVTFMSRGLDCLIQFRDGGRNVELLLLGLKNGLQRDLDPGLAQLTLAGLGAMEIAAAFVLLNTRSRPMGFALAAWGFLSAMSLTVAYGTNGYDLTLIHLADGGVPLALTLFWSLAYQERDAVILADPRDLPPRRESPDDSH